MAQSYVEPNVIILRNDIIASLPANIQDRILNLVKTHCGPNAEYSQCGVYNQPCISYLMLHLNLSLSQGIAAASKPLSWIISYLNQEAEVIDAVVTSIYINERVNDKPAHHEFWTLCGTGNSVRNVLETFIRVMKDDPIYWIGVSLDNNNLLNKVENYAAIGFTVNKITNTTPTGIDIGYKVLSMFLDTQSKNIDVIANLNKAKLLLLNTKVRSNVCTPQLSISSELARILRVFLDQKSYYTGILVAKSDDNSRNISKVGLIENSVAALGNELDLRAYNPKLHFVSYGRDRFLSLTHLKHIIQADTLIHFIPTNEGLLALNLNPEFRYIWVNASTNCRDAILMSVAEIFESDIIDSESRPGSSPMANSPITNSLGKDDMETVDPNYNNIAMKLDFNLPEPQPGDYWIYNQLQLNDKLSSLTIQAIINNSSQSDKYTINECIDNLYLPTSSMNQSILGHHMMPWSDEDMIQMFGLYSEDKCNFDLVVNY